MYVVGHMFSILNKIFLMLIRGFLKMLTKNILSINLVQRPVHKSNVWNLELLSACYCYSLPIIVSKCYDACHIGKDVHTLVRVRADWSKLAGLMTETLPPLEDIFNYVLRWFNIYGTLTRKEVHVYHPLPFVLQVLLATNIWHNATK